MKVTVIGAGRWGSLIAWYLNRQNQTVTLYGRASSEKMQRILKERRNDLLEFPEEIKLTTELASVKEAEVIVISINSQGLYELMEELAPYELENKVFVLCVLGSYIDNIASPICISINDPAKLII